MEDAGEDDVRIGPGGDGREVDSEELTWLGDKEGDCRVGDWIGPRGNRDALVMRKKKRTDQGRTEN